MTTAELIAKLQELPPDTVVESINQSFDCSWDEENIYVDYDEDRKVVRISA